MRTRLFMLVPALLICCSCLCQSIGDLFRYSATSIADSLKSGANAVFRVDEGTVEVISPSKYIYKVHQAVTLLNSKAARYLQHQLHYDKLVKIEDVTVTVYNGMGIKFKEYRKKDFSTRDYYDGVSIYPDSKVLYLESIAPAYPCTIEVSYEIRTSGYIELPDWYVTSPGIAVEQSLFTVKVPADLDIRYKTSGIILNPTITNAPGQKVYTWQAKNITAPRGVEENGYESSSNYPAIHVSPQRFEYDGYKGESQTWNALGAWSYPLYQEEKPFTNEQITFFNQMITDCTTDQEKISVLYSHLKEKMRYVSIQLGIGGFKPFSVQYVQNNQYGDCKALTNYMRYLLKIAGIQSYPALVNAGSRTPPVDPLFPAQQFNHVILCVPLQQDTMWLECTSKNNEAGVLGNFTSDKNALLITEKGGILVPTPRSKSADNLLNTTTEITLADDGSSTVTSNLLCTGDFRDLFYQVDQANSDDKKNILTAALNYRVPDQFSLTHNPDTLGKASYSLGLTYDQMFAFKAGTKQFFDQRINKLVDEDVKPVIRTEAFLFDFPYQKTDTTVYLLAPGTIIDNLPVTTTISNAYVQYKSECIKNDADSKLYVVSSLQVKQRVVPPHDYPLLVESFRLINKNESQKIVLKKG